ncbi:TlpA family protein disulfide reductase [Sphingobacterium humi]|uniref:Redoxin domain-containing protein n=1 Tax=Sphingobacterium humi TaxID=1796905 RepID=A0A6N8L3V2_9SPHI|nr:TlpA disulfide reductase family protein [Sphingobacterium humi]MVZ63121.1 redoxin domain-containing protein [Sphingobacterium humi]
MKYYIYLFTERKVIFLNSKKSLFLTQIIFAFFFSVSTQAQLKNKLPEGHIGACLSLKVGDKVPEEFWTKKHLFFFSGDTIRMDLSNYKGKLLVLDFWSTTCASCIFHHKEIGRFQEAYENDISVIMVNPRNTKDNIERVTTFYQRNYTLKDEKKRDFSSIILDDYLQGIFQFSGYPHYVWINKHGYIQTQTFRNFLDRNYVAPFIDIE